MTPIGLANRKTRNQRALGPFMTFKAGATRTPPLLVLTSLLLADFPDDAGARNLQQRTIVGSDEVSVFAVVEIKRGNQPATVYRYLATVRNLLRIARDEWPWIDMIPKIRLLSGENA